MIVVTGHMVCDPAHTEEFVAAAREVVAASNEGEGCLEYTCSQSLSDPSVFVFVEQWTDGPALRAHIATEHYRRFRAAADPIVISSAAHIHTVEKTRTV